MRSGEGSIYGVEARCARIDILHTYFIIRNKSNTWDPTLIATSHFAVSSQLTINQIIVNSITVTFLQLLQ
jgi:hypothetical protein